MRLLYDAGARYPSEFDLGKAAVLPTLHALGVSALDTIIVSHGDNDHAGGAPAVAHEYPAAQRIGGEPYRGDLPLRQCLAGEAWDWDGVRFRVISPASDLIGAPNLRGDNDRSCVLLVEGEGSRLLLPGDVSTRVEPRIVSAMTTTATTPLVLAVAHHGSRTSSGDAFIARRSSGACDRLGRVAQPLRTSAPRDRRAIRRGRHSAAQYRGPRRIEDRISGDRQARRHGRARASPPLLARTERPRLLSSG